MGRWGEHKPAIASASLQGFPGARLDCPKSATRLPARQCSAARLNWGGQAAHLRCQRCSALDVLACARPHAEQSAIYQVIPQQQLRALPRQSSAERQAFSCLAATRRLCSTSSHPPAMTDQHPGVIEVLDAPAAPAAASGVLARLAEREEARASAAAQRLQQLQVSGDPRESVDAFMEDFASRRQHLETVLQAASGGGGGDTAAVAALAEQIAELEKVRLLVWMK